MGMANAAAGKVDAAIENYRKCIDINGSYHKAFNNIGELYRRKGQLDYAVMVFKMATEMEGAEPHYFYNLGLAYGDVGMHQQSEGSLRKAHEMSPAEFDFASELSQVQFTLNKLEDSIRTLNEFLAVAPGHERRAEAEAKLKLLERRKTEKKAI
jgi:tetratricopeptide (TPR) repeat protein